jgi:mono/diheme cytochrome c family protein
MTLHYKLFLFVALVVPATSGFTGCRGETSRHPPVHFVPNMDFQEKLKAQSESNFPGWEDKRGMRLPVRGTIARGWRGLDDEQTGKDTAKFYKYKNVDGTYIKGNPLPKTAEVLARGRERYEINCSVCHGFSGRGDGIVGRRFPIRPPSFHEQATGDLFGTVYKPTVLAYSDAEIFDVITTGKGTTMQPYATQVTPRDRWAIIHYVRALQLRGKN